MNVSLYTSNLHQSASEGTKGFEDESAGEISPLIRQEIADRRPAPDPERAEEERRPTPASWQPDTDGRPDDCRYLLFSRLDCLVGGRTITAWFEHSVWTACREIPDRDASVIRWLGLRDDRPCSGLRQHEARRDEDGELLPTRVS